MHLFICALWSPIGKGLTSWLSFVVSCCEFVTFPLVSWVRCGTWSYWFLIFAPFLTQFLPIMLHSILVITICRSICLAVSSIKKRKPWPCYLKRFPLYSCPDSEGGHSGPDPPEKSHKYRVSLIPWKSTKLPSQHSSWAFNGTPFKLPMMTLSIVGFGSAPSSTRKNLIKLEKKLDLLWQNLLYPPMYICFLLFTDLYIKSNIKTIWLM